MHCFLDEESNTDASKTFAVTGLPILFPIHTDRLRTGCGKESSFQKGDSHSGISAVIKGNWKGKSSRRYDPIFFSEKYSMDYHCRCFAWMAEELAGYTEKCTVSFMDTYKNTERNIKTLNYISDTYAMQTELLHRFVEIADRNGLYIDTCAEAGNFEALGVRHAHCIDKERIERIIGCRINVDKDTNQRKECGCVASIDIGAYNTCKNGCLYCYANYMAGSVEKNYESHNPKSPLLIGEITEADIIKERKVKSLKVPQLNLLDMM